MNQAIQFMTQKSLPFLAMTAITGVTLATSVFGITNAARNLSAKRPYVPEIKQTQEIRQSSLTETQNPTISPEPTPTVISTQTENRNNRCIITLFGQQYDVTPLQLTHSGGNIFNCGTDMTTVYQSKHGIDISRMRPYLVINPGRQAGTNNSPKPAGVISRIDDDVEDEHDDEKEDKQGKPSSEDQENSLE